MDRYITGLLLPPDAALDSALRESAAAGMPPIAVSPTQGKLLHLLARMQDARLILEIGTLGGYSTIWLARSLPAGARLVTLEVDPRHAEIIWTTWCATARWPIRPAPILTCSASAASTNCWPPNTASAPRRFKPSAAKDTTDSPWRWSSPTCSAHPAWRRFGRAFNLPRASSCWL